jgi:hypothetical protein
LPNEQFGKLVHSPYERKWDMDVILKGCNKEVGDWSSGSIGVFDLLECSFEVVTL